MDTLLQDLRFARRSLAHRPAFAFVAILTLALGIGGTTAIFSVVNAVLIRPLPYAEPAQLVTIWGTAGAQGQQGVVYADYLDWREQNHSFADIGVYRSQSVNLTGGDTPQRLIGSFVSASFLRVIGATAARGRLLLDRETEVGTREAVAVVSHEAWQSRFGGDSALLGRTILLNGQAFQVVGITPPKLPFPFGVPDVMVPIPYYPNANGLARGNRGVWAVGRLKPGVTLQNAERDLKAVAKRQAELYPATNATSGVELQQLREQLIGPAREPIVLVFAAVGVVLLIACANVANLQLARGASRFRELSVRAALGASRVRIARQLLTESVVLSLAGGAAGLGLAVAGTRWLASASANLLPPDVDIHVSREVLWFVLALSVASGIAFGIAPAWKASRAELHGMLRTRSAGSGHAATRNALAVAQLALSLALLASAGLLTRSLIALQRVNTGFETRNVMTMQFRLPPAKYDTPAKIWAMFEQTVREIRMVPGVESAALVRAFPLTGNGESTSIIAADGERPLPGQAPSAQVNTVTPGYFATMRIPIVGGRDIEDADRADAPRAIVVNAEYAARTWPGQSAIGKRVILGFDSTQWTVVGVAGNAKHFTLSERPLLQAYVPHAQRPQIFTTVAVRTAGDPLQLVKLIREAIWRVDHDQPVWGVRTVEQLLEGAVGSPRFIVGLTAGFAIVALLLAAVGIYGVLSYTMARRTHEMGIRMALGAERVQVVRMVVGEGMRLVAVAIAVGLAGSFAATRLLRTQLFGVGPNDPLTLAAVTLLLAGVALVACYVPARRASRVNPTEAMRTE
jgi:putative ABC transport system permease protein